MRKCIIILTIFVLISSICICVSAEDIKDLQEKSNTITESLTESNNRLQAVQGQLSENMQQLQELDTQIAQSQEELNVIDTQVDDLLKQTDENETKLKNTQEQYDKIQELVDSRMLKLYATPKFQTLQILLEAKSITDFLSTYYAIQEVTKADRGLMETVKKQKAEIETTKKILAEKKQQIITSKQSQQKKKQVLANTKKMREYYISKLSTEEQELQSQIDEYNRQASEIEAEIKLLALNSISKDYIGGTMIWPAPGYKTITSEYGMRVHPVTGAYKLHTGVDIGATYGSSFVAAANGIVVKATFSPAYGNMVIIDHGGGVQTLYAHGSEIMVEVGQTVSAGTEVLKVGSTGYSTGPHAHFEIRINGQTVNPLDYLLSYDFNKKLEEKKAEETNNS